MDKIITVKAINKLITESSQEFKAKLGPGVESKDKEINDKAYSDAKKRAKDFDGGLDKELGEGKIESDFHVDDYNKSLMDYTPNNADDDYRKRVKKEFVNGDKNNEKIYNDFKKRGEELQQNEKDLKQSGLQASKWPDKVFDKESMYESKDGFDMRQMIDRMSSMENKQMKPITEQIKTVLFKKTEFLSESHMISKIPDDFKVNGTSFKMRDKKGDEYIVEWKNNKAYVVNHLYKQQLSEEMSRMKELMGYKTSDTSTSSSARLNENDERFRTTLNKVRKK